MKRAADFSHTLDSAPVGLDDPGIVFNGGDQFTLPHEGAVYAPPLSGVLLYSGSSLIASASFLSGVPVGENETEYLFGGMTSNTIVTGDGRQIVSSGGSAVTTTLSAGGDQVVYGGGDAQSTILESGGRLEVYGGRASDVLIESGGYAAFYTDTFGNTTVRGGLLETYAAETGNVLISSGGEVLAQGSLAAVTVSSGGLLTLLRNATNLTVANGGGAMIYSGTIGDITISSGGFALLQQNAAVSSGLIDSGGSLILLPGTRATDVTVQPGGALISTGVVVVSGASLIEASPTLNHTSVGQYTYAYVLAGGMVDSASVNNGHLLVYSGGTVDAAGLLTSYNPYSSTELVLSGGLDIATTVGFDALQTIEAFGSGANETILSGGYQVVDKGVATNVLVLSGGSQEVFGIYGGSQTNLGIVESTTVMNGGYVEADFGAHAEATRVEAGGLLALSYAVSDDTDIQSGGEEYVGSVSTASGTLIESGGVQYVEANGGIYNKPGGAALNATVMSGGLQVLGFLNGQSFGPGIESGTLIEAGGTIDVVHQPYSSGEIVQLNAATDLLTLGGGGTQTTLQLSGDYAGEYFALSNDGTGGTDVTVVEGTPCYCRGTRILTTAGEITVEHLTIGDQLITIGGSAHTLRWIGRRAYDGRFAAGNRDILPILFRAGALGNGLPLRDLTVSPLHAMYLDHVLVPAACLTNGHTIVQIETIDRIEYFHLELDHHAIIIAEGAPSESYLDDANRSMFHNAAEYATLYPHAQPPGAYCAPRVEHGDALEAIRRQIDPTQAQTVPTLQGHLDVASRERIAGWAMQQDGTPVRLRVIANGVVITELTADRPRPDVRNSIGGTGLCGFDLVIEGGLSPDIAHLIQVQRVIDAAELPGSPCRIAPEYNAPAPKATPLRGYLDAADRNELRGWARAGAQAVDLQILDNGIPIGRVIANRHRGDLASADLGDGRCAFSFRFTAPLSPLIRHVIEVRRASDGAAIDNSPILLAPAGSFDAALEHAVTQAVAALDDGDEQRVVHFLEAELDRLRQRHADAHSGINQPRALVIDAQGPTPDHDAGSQAVLSHMLALQRLGYVVSFVAADRADAQTTALNDAGITVCAPPFYAAVEDALRRHAGRFELVYLHRAEIAGAYLALARRWQPCAHIVYAVADLHHLRLARQAEVEQRPELNAASRRLRLIEFTAAWQADAVITHSPHEAAILRDAVPGARVHVVPWVIPARPTTVPFARRRHLAFIANYAHAPNVDAAHWLIDAIMPLVWAIDPLIECHLVGSAMPPSLRAPADPRVIVRGHVPDLATLFNQVRLTVAPLRFGAGLKGKVLESLAAGIPCAMTPIAAEGIPLSVLLSKLVGTTPAELAAIILRLHSQAAASAGAARAGRLLMTGAHVPAMTDAALDKAIAPTARLRRLT